MSNAEPARPAETDLMARMAEAATKIIADHDPSTFIPYRHTAEAVVNAILRTLAEMPEDRVMWEVLSAFKATYAHVIVHGVETETHRIIGQTVAEESALRAASAVLLARQAGEMETLRAENERLRGLCAVYQGASRNPEDIGTIATLRAQLRAAEAKIGTLRQENGRWQDQVTAAESEAERVRDQLEDAINDLAAAESERDRWKDAFERSNKVAVQAGLKCSEEIRQLRDALADHIDGQECEFHPAGRYCMTHGEKATPGKCPNQRGRALLARPASPADEEKA